MKNCGIVCFCIIFLICSSCIAAWPGVDFSEQWHGNWLWMGQDNNDVAVCIDITKWMVKFPGSWEKPLVNYIIGGAANVGIKKVYWCVANDYGMLLYPSKALGNWVYKNTNAGYDFAEIDMPAIAEEIAKLDNVDLQLWINWRPIPEMVDILKEVRDRYKSKIFIYADSDKEVNDIRAKVLFSSDFEGISVASKFPEKNVIDLAKGGSESLSPMKDYITLGQTYRYPGILLFKRQLEILDKDLGGKYKNGEGKEEPVFQPENRVYKLAISAHDKWSVWVNGKFVASGIWKDGNWQDMSFTCAVYDISSFIKSGNNTIAVCVEGGIGDAAFIANVKVGDLVYGCNTNWKVRKVDSVPDPNNIGSLLDTSDEWFEPMIMSRGDVWPRWSQGRVHWDRIVPIFGDK